jgi:hypothetical protein
MNVVDWPDNRATLTKDNYDDYLNVIIPTDAVYGGEEKLPEVSADENKKLGQITVKYADEAGNAVEKPVNAGTYKVLVDITDGIDVNETTDLEESGQKNSQSTLEQIYILIKNNPSITRKQLVEETGKASSYIQRCINQLKETKRIQRVGGDKGGFWEIIE